MKDKTQTFEVFCRFGEISEELLRSLIIQYFENIFQGTADSEIAYSLTVKEIVTKESETK